MFTLHKLAPLFLALPLAFLPACNRADGRALPPKAEAVVKSIPVEVSPAMPHTFSGRLPITGELKPIQEVTLKSRIGGNVVLLKVDEGDKVKQGELIAKIEAGNQKAQLRSSAAAMEVASAQLARAQADLERLKLDLARIEKLSAQGASNQKTLDDTRTAMKLGAVAVRSAEAQLNQARASRDLSRNAVRETKYVAPFAGVVSHRGVSLHEYLDTVKSREIVTIVDNSAMELVAQVAADLASGVTRGSKVDFHVSAAAAASLAGEVISVSPTVDTKTRTIRLRVRIPNPDGLLKGGMYATGFVTVGGERSGVAVKAQALHQEAGPGAHSGDAGGEGPHRVVWRVRGGTAEKLVVRTGITDGDLTEVLDGVQIGEQIVVSSPAGLTSGGPVSVRSSPGSLARSHAGGDRGPV